MFEAGSNWVQVSVCVCVCVRVAPVVNACVRVCGCRVSGFLFGAVVSLRVQVPNCHILSKIVTYITTIPNPST